jgi:peptidyl-prolyl cis-trans isomerase B (cyclophilin B)
MNQSLTKPFAVLFILCMAMLVGTSCASKESRASEQEDQSKLASAKELQPTNQDNMKTRTRILFTTSLGDITIALYDETPLHRDNFIKLVKENYYDGILFHRIIKEFMIQTGDPNSKIAKANEQLGNGGPGYTIPAEFVPSLIHKRGAVAAARTGDHMNPKKASSGSQFYIVDGKKWSVADMNSIAAQTGKKFTQEQIEIYSTLGGSPFLDGDYTVFGEVISGMEIVDKIASQSKDRFDRPTTDIKIISARIIEP